MTFNKSDPVRFFGFPEEEVESVLSRDLQDGDLLFAFEYVNYIRKVATFVFRPKHEFPAGFDDCDLLGVLADPKNFTGTLKSVQDFDCDVEGELVQVEFKCKHASAELVGA